MYYILPLKQFFNVSIHIKSKDQNQYLIFVVSGRLGISFPTGLVSFLFLQTFGDVHSDAKPRDTYPVGVVNRNRIHKNTDIVSFSFIPLASSLFFSTLG